MKRFLNILSTAFLLLLLMAPTPAQAVSIPSATDATTVIPVQYWRMGITVQPSPLYGAMAGRVISAAAGMQSSREAKSHFAFPAVSGRRFVQEASFYILSRSGAYSGTAAMTLEVYDYAGTLKRVVSAGRVDLESAAPLAWTRLELSRLITDRLIEPGEFLAFHFALDGAPGGDLDVRPVFEVTVGPVQAYLPLVKR